MQRPRVTEGFISVVQREHIQTLIQEYIPNVQHILDIGFNAGHSAEAFLQTNPDVYVTSVDIGFHSYIHAAKEYIDQKYPNRHRLIIGDSTKVLPNELIGQTFDLIFIDGGHAYETVRADLRNCKTLSHEKTLVLMNDTIHQRTDWVYSYNQGPTRAWKEVVVGKQMQHLGAREYARGHGMSWGRYRL